MVDRWILAQLRVAITWFRP